MSETTTIKDLAALALNAHRRGITFTDFWPTVSDAAKELEPWSRRAYHRLHNRLMHICITGSEGGQYPPGDDDAIMPWVVDDAADVEMQQLFGEVD